eukprot:5406080-Pleurochrysis_carterae.AAC.5
MDRACLLARALDDSAFVDGSVRAQLRDELFALAVLAGARGSTVSDNVRAGCGGKAISVRGALERVGQIPRAEVPRRSEAAKPSAIG